MTYNQPLGGNEMPRFGGPATMMRLPTQATAEGLDACFVGIPMDIGTSNRAGTRHGPRQIRAESCLIRPYGMGNKTAPFDNLQVADIGDLAINTFNLNATCGIITDGISAILECGATPLIMGGDHTLTYPTLVAIAKKFGPVALIHVDAHADTSDMMFGEKIAHGTPFRRIVEERLIYPTLSIQIGLRGSGYTPDDFDWGRNQGIYVVQAEECWYKSLTPMITIFKERVGPNTPVYLSFDIDSLDPAFAPGTGTVEIGGLTTIQALEIIRGCSGLNIVGADLVEVSPPYDPSGNTALTGANLLFEMLCALPGANGEAKNTSHS